MPTASPATSRQSLTASAASHLETLAIIAVIALSAWHVGHYLAPFDGAGMAALLGATLGLANALAAYRFIESERQNTAALLGVIFFAGASVWLQRSFYLDAGAPPIDALLLGAWAPVAEILLGWLKATTTRRNKSDLVDTLRAELAAANATAGEARAGSARLSASLETARRQLEETKAANRELAARLAERQQLSASAPPAAPVNPPPAPADSLSPTERQRVQLVADLAGRHKLATAADLAALAEWPWSERSAQRYISLALSAGIVEPNGNGALRARVSRNF